MEDILFLVLGICCGMCVWGLGGEWKERGRGRKSEFSLWCVPCLLSLPPPS